MKQAITPHSTSEAAAFFVRPLFGRLASRTTIIIAVSLLYAVVLAVDFAILLLPERLSLRLEVSETGPARVTWTAPSGILWERGVRSGDAVIALDGRAPGPRDGGWWAGHSVLVRAGSGQTILVDASTIHLGRTTWPLLLLSPWFLLLGTLVYLRASEPGVRRATYALFGTAAFALALAPAAIDENLVAAIAEWVTVTLFAPCFLLFFMVFPKPRGSARLRATLLIPAVLVAALGVVALFQTMWFETASALRLAVLLVYILSGLGLMLHSLATAREHEIRRGLVITAVGTATSILPFLGLYVLPELLRQPHFVAAEEAILPLALLPASFAYAILRHNVLRVPLLQRWLVQGVLWAGLIIAYTLVVYAQYRLLEPLPEPWRSVIMAALLVLVIGVSFSWLSGRLRAFLDRLIFKDSYDYRASLQELSRDLSFAGDLDTLAASLPSTLLHLMNLDFAVLVIQEQDGPCVRGSAGAYQPEMLPALLDAAHNAPDVPKVASLAYGYFKVLLVPLRTHDELIGYLCLGPKASGEPFRTEDRDLLATLSGHLAAIVRNSQLVDNLRANVSALDALNERMQHAQEEERAHLAAEIHDEPLQTAMVLQRQMVASGLGDQGQLALSQTLVDQLRGVCTSMRPAALDDLGLYAAFETLALEQGERAGVPVVLELDTATASDALSGDAELVLYRAAQEAINNSLRHTQPSNIRVALQREGELVRLRITDDGAGFVVPDNFDSLVAQGHLGLAGLRKRVERLGGRLTVCSSPGRGTTVQVELPVRMPA